ncbi:hypothetical protein EYD10_15725 [Varanus komodoensis]|nr:hypothetical protein EYD10_15725 [Varanus komodoensis]
MEMAPVTPVPADRPACTQLQPATVAGWPLSDLLVTFAPSSPLCPNTGQQTRSSSLLQRSRGMSCFQSRHLQVAGAYSKTWSYREDSLLAIYKKMMEISTSTPKEDLKNLLRGAIFLIVRAIKDIVSSVFQTSLKLLKMIITQYIPKHKLGKQETAHCVERTLPNLLSRTGDSSARLRTAAANFIQEMALCNEVKPLQIVPAHLLQPLKPNAPTHLAMSQVELVERLLKDLGTENSGFSVDNIMRFAAGALEHRVYEVRETALRIILDMYRQHRAAIFDYLPPDDSNTRKNVLYKTLFDGFAKIDGKLTEVETRTQKKMAAEEAEKQKKDEIKALQSQLATLKEMQTEAQAAKEKESDFQKSKNHGETFKKASQPAAAEMPDDHSSVANYLDNLCIFCGERDESFTEEGLDLHYWKRCPMLTRCDFCKQQDDTALMAESEEELKSLLIHMKEESAKVGLKLNVKKTKIMASGPLTSWQIDGEEMDIVTDFIYLGSKITTDGDCSQEIKRRLLLRRKAMANLDSILKSRDITLTTKVRIVKAMVFPVAMYGCESWTIRKAEHRRIEAFELWCWRRLLRVPWTARRSNQSVLEEINPDCSLEGQILKVVEIASLTEHLLTECDKKDTFGKCLRCCEALPKEELPRHVKGKACNRLEGAPDGQRRMPHEPEAGALFEQELANAVRGWQACRNSAQSIRANGS